MMLRGKQISYSGPHIILDCFDCDKEKLSDTALIYDTLDTFPQKIGMEKIMDPYVFKYTDSDPQSCGITGVVLIADSHITIHTFPEKRHAFIDIFSSKDFDSNFAISFMKTLFGAKDQDIQISSRGADLPQTPAFAN